MSDKFTAKIKYIGDDPYSYYRWTAIVYCNGEEVANESSDWRWWLFVWIRFAALGYRSRQRQKSRDRARGTKNIDL